MLLIPLDVMRQQSFPFARGRAQDARGRRPRAPRPRRVGIYLFKFDAAGTAVAGFGTTGNGFAGPFQDTGAEATSVALQADGKILVQLATTNNDRGLDTLRFTPDGALDKTFGQGGRVTRAGDFVVVDKTGRILVARLTIGLTAYWP